MPNKRHLCLSTALSKCLASKLVSQSIKALFSKSWVAGKPPLLIIVATTQQFPKREVPRSGLLQECSFVVQVFEEADFRILVLATQVGRLVAKFRETTKSSRLWIWPSIVAAFSLSQVHYGTCTSVMNTKDFETMPKQYTYSFQQSASQEPSDSLSINDWHHQSLWPLLSQGIGHQLTKDLTGAWCID